MTNKLTIVCGPTAVGKSAVAAALCKKFGGEIVSADSQQVYRGMNVGTAKEDLTGSGVKCHLVDIVDPDQPFDAALFAERADKVIADINGRGVRPIVAGGTGLYIRALVFGLFKAPGRDESLREDLMEIREKEGQGKLYEILKKEDPLVAAKLHLNDVSRVVRAIEVKRLTGSSILELQKKANFTDEKRPQRYETLKIGLDIDRDILYDRINKRVDRMIENGLIDEVKGLVDKYGADIQSLRAVGYKEAVAYLNGEITLNESIDLTKRNTRRLAKRQLTWFRADKEIKWFHPDEFEKIETLYHP